MNLQNKTLEKLRILINEETEYRSGPKLVQFFNELGFNDSYEQGFPSRWVYTDNRLAKLNGTPELDKCIRNLFSPVNFIGRVSDLDNFINEFNQYLAFDKWKVVRNGAEITFARADKINFEDSHKKTEITEEDFLNKEFGEVSLESLGLEGIITNTLTIRFSEIKSCLAAEAPLSVIFLCGSSLEGILLGMALKHPKEFNQSNTAPKDKEGKVRKFQDWTLKVLWEYKGYTHMWG